MRMKEVDQGDREDLYSGCYVRDTQGDDEIFVMIGDPEDRRVRIEDKDGRGWYIPPHRLTLVDENDPAVAEWFPENKRELDENMKRKKVNHNKVYNMIINLAIKSIKGWPTQLKARAKFDATSDAFWTPSIDEATKELEEQINDSSKMDYNAPMQAFLVAVEDVAEKIISYYENSLNFGPKSQIVKPNILQFDSRGLDDITLLRAIKRITGEDISGNRLLDLKWGPADNL